jgi:pimeloyl-ACP methyl ester carboxylesterase
VKPDVRITWNDGFALAYQVVGTARDDLVYRPGFASNVDLMWDIPEYRRFLERLSSFSRLITLDRRGVGCSDRMPPGRSPTLEEITDDVLAVMEAVHSTRATVFAAQEEVFPALLLAATYPKRVERLVLFSASPSWVRSEDLPDEWTPDDWDSQHRAWERATSATEFADGYIRGGEPSFFGDESAKRALASLFLNTAGFGAAIAEARMFSQVDLRRILPTIAAPTLVIRRRDDTVTPATSSRHLAEHIRGAEYLEVPGRDGLPWIGDQEPILEALERFMGVERQVPASDRRLATVLFTDIVDSSTRATQVGDSKWAALVAAHHRVLRDHLAEHGGAERSTRPATASSLCSRGPRRRSGARSRPHDPSATWDLRSERGCTPGRCRRSRESPVARRS